MANKPENLIPLNKRSKEDAKVIQTAGGVARGKKITENKTMREWAKVFGNVQVEIKMPDGSTSKTTTLGNIVAAQMAKATRGDTKAARFVADLLGEITKTVNLNTPTPLVISDKEAEALDKWTKDE